MRVTPIHLGFGGQYSIHWATAALCLKLQLADSRTPTTIAFHQQ